MLDRTNSFGYWLRRRRKALDLTQKALADAVSCSHFAIRKIEADERRPSRRLAERLADKLGIAAHERNAFIGAARASRALKDLPMASAPLARPQASEEGGLFVGRLRELESLIGLVGAVAPGQGRVVLVEGEPGIGKTRLMREVARHAGSLGMRSLHANCYEIEHGMAYQPVIDLVTRALSRLPDDALARMTPAAIGELTTLVPTLAGRIPVPAPAPDLPPARQARLSQSIAELLQASAGSRPVIVTIDDIQWADEATLQFVHYLARQAEGMALLLMCGYRNELGLRPRLAGLVSSLQRKGHVVRVALEPFTLPDIEELVGAAGNGKLDAPGLAERLLREASGNPLFVIAMLQSLDAADAQPRPDGSLPLPMPLRDAIRGQLARLPEDERSVLQIAAALGREFDFGTLATVTGLAAGELLRIVETLMSRKLLKEELDGELHDFAHEKVREAVYLDMTGARRMQLHRMVAETIEARDAGATHEADPWLAEQFARAGMWTKAYRYFVRSAQRAQSLFAVHDAVNWLDRAVELSEAHPEAIDRKLLSELYRRRGTAYGLAGDLRGAIASYERSIDAGRDLDGKPYESGNHLMIGAACTGYMGLADYPRAEAAFAKAAEIAKAKNRQRRVGPSLLGLYHVRACVGRYGEAWSGMTSTLRWLESTRQMRYQMMAFDFMSHLLIDVGLNGLAVEHCERGIAIATAEGLEFWRPRIEANLAIARMRLGFLDNQAALEAALAASRRSNFAHQAVRCLEGLAELAFLQGDASACMAAASDLIRVAEPAGMTEAIAQARLWRGQALARQDAAAALEDIAYAAGIADEIGRVRLSRDAHRALAGLFDRSRSKADAARHSAIAHETDVQILASLKGSELANPSDALALG